jgi:two-component system cell cycle sensor histidine kinase/response regulator CckA
VTAHRILIVEDEAIVAMDIAMRLELSGYQVVGTAPSAERALTLARSQRPDLVLMDIRLQGPVDGVDAAIELRRRHQVPVVFLTAHAEDATIGRARTAEPFGYVLKPFEDRELHVVIEMALFKHKAEAELRHQARLYAVLSQTNQAIVRAADPQRLEPDVCELAVRFGEFPLAWIGRYRPDGTLAMVACSSSAPDLHTEMCDRCNELLADVPRADAWGANKPFRADATALGSPAWRALASRHDLRDLAAVAIRIDGAVVGVLGLHSTEGAFFGAREVALVEEMALDVGFALGNFAREAARLAAERTLAERESLLRTLADNVRDLLCLLDLDGRFAYATPSFTRTLGYDVGQLIGTKAIDSVFPSDVAAVASALESCLAERRSVSREFRINNAEGDVVWVEAIANPVVDGDGPVTGTVVTARDISDRRAAVAALQDREDQLRGLYEQAPIGIYRVTADGVWIAANPTALRMLDRASKDELVARGPGRAGAALSVVHAEVAAGGAVTGRALAWRGADGQPIHARVNARGVIGPGGAVRFVDVTLEDVTEMQAAEAERARLAAQLTQAQRLESIGQLAGGVAHDFNNILAVIMLTLATLRAQSELSADSRSMLDEVDDAANRAADLTRQLLMFSRRSVMAVRPLDLDEGVRSLSKMLQRLLGEDIALRYRCETTSPWIDGDPGMIDQVITNLCVNARDAMPTGGAIAIVTTRVEFDEVAAAAIPEARPGSYLCLAVSDQGHGMDEETRARIFEPFFTTKAVGKGTGLGLATVHGIVRQHGGWIEVESQPGAGATFRVYLPARGERRDAVTSGPAGAAAGNGELVLLVEDDAMVLKAAGAALRLHGYRVLEANDGISGFAAWAEHADEVRLLLTDMIMPGGLTGLDLAERLRAVRPNLPIVVLSGYSPERALERGHALGGVTYVPKPCAPELLVRVISDRLAGK